MKRQKKIKNIKMRLPSFLEPVREYLVRKLYVATAILVVALILFIGANTFLHKSEYFRLRSVEVRDAIIDKALAASIASDLLQAYKGRNIFEIDITKVAERLKASHPDAKRLAVRRVMPDRLLVSFNLRKPVAIVSNAKSYPIDGDFYVMPNVDTRYLRELVVITGIKIRPGEAKDGRVESNNLRAAVNLLKEIKRHRFLAEYGVTRIEAGDFKEMSFYLKNGIEVKIGYENLASRLALLAKTLKDPRLAMERIKYIDVRFENVVIGPTNG